MRLLILGGTVFLGRHLVEAAQARGHAVTLFNRGQHNPDLFPDAEKLRGDRDGQLDALRGRTWDAVIDTCGYVPRVVRQSAELLAGAVGHYTFVSTLNVYPDESVRLPDLNEETPLATLPETWSEDDALTLYGPLKAACEGEVEAALPGRSLHARLGLIVGRHDRTHRFSYWPRRIAAGGDVLVPDARSTVMRIVIDARDLAEWLIGAAEAGRPGPYNLFGPDYPLTLGTLWNTCREVSGSDARFVAVPEQFLLDHDVKPWADIPLWSPGFVGHGGFTAVARKALDAGLTFRPLADTVRDTLLWEQSLPPDHPRPNGLDPAREREVLAAWWARKD